MDYCLPRDITVRLLRKRWTWQGDINFSVKGDPGSFGSIDFDWPKDKFKVSLPIYIPNKENAKELIESRTQYALDHLSEIVTEMYKESD